MKLADTKPALAVTLLGLVVSLAGCAGGSSNGNQNPNFIAPSISVQPASQTVTVGQTAMFTVMATGTAPLSYQWQKDGASISAATSSSYTTPPITSADNGAKFQVVISNPAGSMSSNEATLTVTPGLTLQSIAVAPLAPSIAPAQTQQLIATGTYSDSSTKNITTSVTWVSSNAAVATIGTNTGLATGVTAGTSEIAATLGSVVSPNDTLTVKPITLQSIAVTPPAPSIAPAQTQQFIATGTYSDSSTKNITTSVTWASSNSAVATVGTNTGLATGVTAGASEITATLGSVVSPNDTLTITVTSASTVDVVTYHNDAMRTGLNSGEIILTPNNVNPATFGKVGEFPIDSRIDGQILYLSQLAIPGKGTKNVLYFGTENATVYAVDADSITGSSATILWQAPAIGIGETAVPLASLPCGNIDPNGITATPVIDRSRNAIYVIAMSTDGKGNFFHRLHALDLTTGKELFGGPTKVNATYPGTGGNSSGGTVSFLPEVHAERAALLESGNKIYTAWSGRYGDCGQYSAWVIAFDAGTLAQTGAIDLVPHTHGAGIWLGGGGPASDTSGDVYLATGNAFGGNTPGISNDYGDTFVRLSGSALSPVDYFAPSNAIANDIADADFGSSGPLLLPDLVDSSNITRHLAVTAGKDGVIYVVNRDNMGQYDATTNNVYQQLPSDGHENFSTPVYFNNAIFIGPSGLSLRAFPISQAHLATTPSTQSAHTFGSNGAVPSVSSNGNSHGIVWALDYEPGILFAYDATDLGKELYDSNQAAGNRDHFSPVAGHFITPLVVNGRVYFGTGSTVAVFGLLGP